MTITEHTPTPGENLIRYCGDTIIFTLKLDKDIAGTAWLRTNIGHAQEHRQEVIEHIEQNKPMLSRDWHDIPMQSSNPKTAKLDQFSIYAIEMPLSEVGRFQAKAFFIPHNTPSEQQHNNSETSKHTANTSDPIWPEGDNITIKVEPAATVCGNSIYTAFVRQFGPNMAQRKTSPNCMATIEKLDNDGYTVIPKSGTFRKLISELDHIINTMGFGIIQLLPIHPVPTTYARMGRFGSPFASIDFFDVDPALAEFDRKTTPLDQFQELVDAVHSRNASIYLDLPINHTGWASHLQIHHPDWFARNEDTSFTSPGAWGVTWEDLSELDYSHNELWQYMADVFLFWCRRGVNGFRCDAGYMIPLPVWEYITAKVRQEYPNTIFLLEGLGGKIVVTEKLLDQANLNWAYSEIFQMHDRTQLESYLPRCHNITNTSGTMVHFAETHDNNRLAATSISHSRLRTALAALCSESGAFGITNGVEWFATEKVDVHSAATLNWNSPENQIEDIAILNNLLKEHPAFQRGVSQQVIPSGIENTLALLRSPKNYAPVIIVANLDENSSALITLSDSLNIPDAGNSTFHDLLSNKEVSFNNNSIELQPSQVLCLSQEKSHIPESNSTKQIASKESDIKRNHPNRLQLLQKANSTALSLYNLWSGNDALKEINTEELCRQLTSNPDNFYQYITNAPVAKSITGWNWPQDLSREVMLPNNHTLLVKCPAPFYAELCDNKKRLTVGASLKADAGDYFAFLTPSQHTRERIDSLNKPAQITLNLTTLTNSAKHTSSPILQLPSGKTTDVKTSFSQNDIRNKKHYALLTNNRGAISQVQLNWGNIESQYDCLLGANLNDQVPVDRKICFSRCRAWLVHRDYSSEITSSCIERITLNNDNSISWLFNIPIGMGQSIDLQATLELIQNRNQITIRFEQINTQENKISSPLTLILRPDVEDRNFHETTKAYTGLETSWPNAISSQTAGFSFSPSHQHKLEVKVSDGEFILEPEWKYNIPHPFEAQRGLNDSGDLFSPGYFKTNLSNAQAITMTATVHYKQEAEESSNTPKNSTHNSINASIFKKSQPLLSSLHKSMRDFIVKRDETRTVIAGYPWFLDWGRDTLICLRGIISAGMHAEAKDILMQFAGFEKQGTIPNMIRGNDDSNRDTSDAPLWFFTACADLCSSIGENGTNDLSPDKNGSKSNTFLSQTCNGRTIRQILSSIANNYINGTPNGIKMDPESALIFSPSHYTWMDTNHPAGTPREGYPIEIQALWFAALKFMSNIDDNPRWTELATQVQTSIIELFWIPDCNYLADCLHASSGTPAKSATPDNALRPNQLFTITLGAIIDRTQMQGILSATEKLLIPGAIRSLADQPVTPPLPVYRDGQLINDPNNPYWGEYAGDEDTRRKPAYHNGTAWTWPFPSYCEALYIFGGDDLRATALSILSSSTILADNECVTHIPEILDANTPHAQRGCGAQAWGETELYRILKILDKIR